MKLKIKIKIGTAIKEFTYTMNNSTSVPDNDFLLRLYSLHHHKSKKYALPPTAEVLNVEVI